MPACERLPAIQRTTLQATEAGTVPSLNNKSFNPLLRQLPTSQMLISGPPGAIWSLMIMPKGNSCAPVIGVALGFSKGDRLQRLFQLSSEAGYQASTVRNVTWRDHIYHNEALASVNRPTCERGIRFTGGAVTVLAQVSFTTGFAMFRECLDFCVEAL